MSDYAAPVGAPIWFDLMSTDPARAAEFYHALFGWEVEAPPQAEFGGYQNFTANGRRVAGLVPHMGGVPNVWSVYLHTADAALAPLSADQQIGQIAVQLPGATAVFRRLKLDFCCGGQVPLAKAAADKGLDVEAVLRELSALPCRRDESWGVGRNEVWVSRGCKGEFEVGERDGGFPPGARLLTCESKERQRRSCGVSVTRSATLFRQLSGMPCVEGSTWGWDAERVWVDKGCRAEFSVD